MIFSKLYYKSHGTLIMLNLNMQSDRASVCLHANTWNRTHNLLYWEYLHDWTGSTYI